MVLDTCRLKDQRPDLCISKLRILVNDWNEPTDDLQTCTLAATTQAEALKQDQTTSYPAHH